MLGFMLKNIVALREGNTHMRPSRGLNSNLELLDILDKSNSKQIWEDTVDGRNAAPPGMYTTL